MANDIEEEIAAARSREAFQTRLDKISSSPVTLYNDIDSTSPSLGFRFVEESIICDGVVKASKESMYGCTCKSENGGRTSCEDTTCACLDQMAESEFPYTDGTLRDGHLETRNAIFECNPLCNCDDSCKNKLVQWGRRVPLEIFKTSNRGWGKLFPGLVM
jgi:[histone H3]-lysine9 N-trimethyltransferase SUV39H